MTETEKLTYWLKDQIQQEYNWLYETGGRDIRSEAKIEAYKKTIEKLTGTKPSTKYKYKPTAEELRKAQTFQDLQDLGFKYGYKPKWAEHYYEGRRT